MKCVIFDLDGTLLYTLEDLYKATNYALSVFNHTPRTIDEVRNFVGNGVKKLIERSLGEGYDEEDVEKCLLVFREYYSKNAQKHTKPYDGIVEILKYLNDKNIKVAVNSNKYDAAVKSLCKEYFGNLVSLAVGETPNCPKKPSPNGVNKILEYFNCAKSDAIYVGDSLVDIQTARNAEIPCISVSWGYCSKDVLHKYNNQVAHSAKDLIHMLSDFIAKDC